MAIKDDILQDALKSESHPKKVSLYSRMKLIESTSINQIEAPEKTGNKATTNWQQSDNTTGNKLATNWQQSDNKNTIISKNWQQTGNATDNTTGNKLATKRQQSDNKATTITSFFSLVGLQRAILIAIYQVCKISRSHITDPLTLEFFVTQVNTDTKTIKTTLQRLEKKGGVIRVEFKNGRGGWSKYRIPDYVYNEMLNLESVNKVTTNWQQTGNKLASEVATQPTTSPSSSSSNDLNINKNTTTTGLPPEWQAIDLSELHKRGINFNQGHLTSLWPFLKPHAGLDFQDSINGLAYDLDHGHLRPDKGALNVLIGVIRKGGLYTSAHYASPAQQQINAILANGEKMREQRFLAWAEQNRLEIYKRIREHSASLAIDFNHRGKESLAYVKEHLYLKMLKEDKI